MSLSSNESFQKVVPIESVRAAITQFEKLTRSAQYEIERLLYAYDDTLPHDLEAEQRVIGSLLVASTLPHEEAIPILTQIIQSLQPESFYRKEHTLLWQAATLCVQKNLLCDHLTLRKAVANIAGEEGIASIQNGAYLYTLSETAPCLAGWEYYAKLVHDMCRKRKLYLAAVETQRLCNSLDSADAVSAKIKQLFRGLL